MVQASPSLPVDEALRQSEERFRLLVEAVKDYAIFMLNPAGEVASWNTGAQRIKGYAATEIIGQHFRVFYPAERQASRHPERELEIALHEGRYEEEGWRIRKGGGRFWANVVITAIRNPAGDHLGFTKVTRDVTERGRLLQERIDAATALEIANRELEKANVRLARAVADQSQFLAVTAHELRNPIAVLSGSARTLGDYWPVLTDVERTELLDAMSLSSRRVSRLLNDLLTASRLEANAIELHPMPVRLDALLGASVATARAADRDAAIDLDIAPGLTVFADPERLAQAVDNLISNAIQHGRPPVSVEAHEDAGNVQIRVRDGGSGVAEELVPRLFQRFASGEHHRGTGLGLFIVRELARSQGGDAWYESPSGQSSFVLSMPVDSAAPREWERQTQN
jgi:PAS domain S-box-containing protein